MISQTIIGSVILVSDQFSDQFFFAPSRLLALLLRRTIGHRNRHEPIYRRAVMQRREMCVSHGHLNAAVSHQFAHGAEIDSCHNQPTCKRMPVAMPGVVFDLGFGQRIIELAPIVVLRVSAIPEDIHQL
ncbi:MAG: hypothetical protein WB425_08955 [Terracidiphilus sp.]